MIDEGDRLANTRFAAFQRKTHANAKNVTPGKQARTLKAQRTPSGQEGGVHGRYQATRRRPLFAEQFRKSSRTASMYIRLREGVCPGMNGDVRVEGYFRDP